MSLVLAPSSDIHLGLFLPSEVEQSQLLLQVHLGNSPSESVSSREGPGMVPGRGTPLFSDCSGPPLGCALTLLSSKRHHLFFVRPHRVSSPGLLLITNFGSIPLTPCSSLSNTHFISAALFTGGTSNL